MKTDGSRWIEHVKINVHWLGLNTATSILTPVLLPHLVAQYVSQANKNTALAVVRVAGLAVATFVQPLAGTMSDATLTKLGRRTPYILAGTGFSILSLLVVAFSHDLTGLRTVALGASASRVSVAYGVLLVGVVLYQLGANVSQGALQGLIPDLVAEDLRGTASGVKSAMEILPAFLIVLIGPLVDAGRIGLTLAVAAGTLAVTALVTLFGVRERKVGSGLAITTRSTVAHLLGQTLVFLGGVIGAVWVVRRCSRFLAERSAAVGGQAVVLGTVGLGGMTCAILAGVYLGVRLALGSEAGRHPAFTRWVAARLFFLTAAGGVQGLAQYFLADVLEVANPATATSILAGTVALTAAVSALAGGYLSDRVGQLPLALASGVIGALGTVLLLFVTETALVVACAVIIGAGVGMFFATSWPLGIALVPLRQAGRYLGIANLAGAGAGIVGMGIGGPVVDLLNALRPGLGYTTVFAVYAVLFVLGAAMLMWVRGPGSVRR
jgi:MFS family permease